MFQQINKLSAIALMLLMLLSCRNSQKVSGKISGNVVANTDSNTAIILLPEMDTVKHHDTIQIEFGNKLAVPYDSIYNLALFRYIKENLGKKCTGTKKQISSCEAFVSMLFRDVYGIDFPVTAAEQMKYKNLELFKDSSYLKLSDLLFFNYSSKQPDKISHVGLYLYNSYFLVASYNEGIAITNLNTPYWSKHFVAAGRINKLTSTEKQ